MAQAERNEPLLPNGQAADTNEPGIAPQPSASLDWASLILEGIEETLFSVDTSWRFTYLNDHAMTVFGQAKENLLGKVLWEVFPSLVGSKFEPVYRHAMAVGTPQHIEDFSFTTQSWYDVRAYPITQGLIIYFQDITACKLAETAVAQQAQRARVQAAVSHALAEVTHDYQTTLDTAANQLAVTLGDTCIIRLIAPDMQGVDLAASAHPDPVAAAFIHDALAATPRQRVAASMAERVFQTGQPLLIPVTSSAQIKTFTDPQYWVYLDRFPVFSVLIMPLRATGRIIGAIMLMRNIPEQSYTDDDLTVLHDLADHVALAIMNARLLQQAQQELIERTRLEAQLVQAQKMESVGRLAGGIAHDFNNLLTGIMGYSELILGELSATDRHYFDVQGIKQAAQRAAALTRHLLAFSRQQILEPTTLNLNTVVTEMGNLLNRTIREDITLVTILEPTLDPVLADMHQLEQVLLNLVVNARDAMPTGGHLTIETMNVELDAQYRSFGHPDVETGSYVMLAVSDTGVGMDQATQALIFEPFFTTKDVGQGTGLGLATVYGIVRQSAGYVWVYSEVGVGTTFKIYLPRATDQTVAPPPIAPEPSPAMPSVPPKQQTTILVVEDDALVRALIHRVLHEAGYTILDAHNGQVAFDVLATSAQVDLVLTDIVMPQVGGYELVTRLQHDKRQLKVICMSGYTDRTVLNHGIIHVCDAFLQKPFTPRVLLEQIAAILQG